MKTARFSRPIWVVCLAIAATLVAGCGGVIQTSDGQSIPFTVVTGPGAGGVTGGPGAPGNSPLQPGPGGPGTPDPTLPPTGGGTNPPPAPLPTGNSPAAPSNSGATGSQLQDQIQQQYSVSISGPDASNTDYLNTIAFALARYPSGSMKGLNINIQIESFDQTGGVGGVWYMDGNQPTLTVYQASNDYRHIIIHELAHNFDIYDNNEGVTNNLINSASAGSGNVPDQDVPSPYANYGLQNGKQVEYGAEVISWSLDTVAVNGFSTYSSWQPDTGVKQTLDKYLDPSKLVI